MKRFYLQQTIADLIEAGIKEGVAATDSTDSETWAVAQSLAEEIIDFLKRQGIEFEEER